MFDKLRAVVLWLAVVLPGAGLLTMIAGGTTTFSQDSWLYKWQTLVAGLVAIFAAIIGARAVQRQVRLADQHEFQRNRRRFDGARAVLPHALSRLSAYTRSCGEVLAVLYAAREAESIPTGAIHPAFPDMDRDLVRELREMVEAAEQPMRDVLATLLGEMQVQYARITDMANAIATNPNRVTTVSNVEEYILDTAEIDARTSALYDFARREVETVPNLVLASEVTAALRRLDFRQPQYERVHAACERRYP